MKKFIVPLIVLALMLGGCATTTSTTSTGTPPVVQQPESPQEIVWKGLAIAGQTYTATMKSVAEMYGKGFIDKATNENIIKYARDFKTAYDLAVDVLEKGGVPSLDMVQETLSSLVNFVKPYMLKGK